MLMYMTKCRWFCAYFPHCTFSQYFHKIHFLFNKKKIVWQKKIAIWVLACKIDLWADKSYYHFKIVVGCTFLLLSIYLSIMGLYVWWLEGSVLNTETIWNTSFYHNLFLPLTQHVSYWNNLLRSYME